MTPRHAWLPIVLSMAACSNNDDDDRRINPIGPTTELTEDVGSSDDPDPDDDDPFDDDPETGTGGGRTETRRCDVSYIDTDSQNDPVSNRDAFAPRINVLYQCEGGNIGATVLFIGRAWSEGELIGEFDKIIYLDVGETEWLCHDNNSAVAPRIGCGFNSRVPGQSRGRAAVLPNGTQWRWNSATRVCTAGAIAGSATCRWPEPPSNPG